MNSIGKLIRYMRKRKKLTQAQLAEKIGVSTTSIWHWECELCYPNIMNCCDLADLFGCTIDELVGRTELKS